MDPLEKAIRSAFEKGNAEDKAFRMNVYRKAFTALDRALQANPDLPAETVANRRKMLQAKIVEIETEFLPAVTPAPQHHPQPQQHQQDPLSGSVRMQMEPHAASAPDYAPEVRLDAPERRTNPPRRQQDRLEPEMDRPEPSPITSGRAPEVRLDADAMRSRKRGLPWATFFVTAALIALLGMGILFAYQTGLFSGPEEQPVLPRERQSEDYTPGNEAPARVANRAAAEAEWISIFKPSDATRVNAPSGTRAEVMEDGTGSFLRISSGDTDKAVVFDVGQGVLKQIAGKKAIFDIVARGGDSEKTEITVTCNFNELGDCGRKRYPLGFDRADSLFDVTLPAGEPRAAGQISITSDLLKAGKSADIYEIKVSIQQ